MVQMKDNDYVYGSLAKQIQYEYDVYEHNKVLKEKKTYRLNRAVKLKAVILILITFAVGFAAVYRYALIADLNYRLSDLEKKYEELVDENTQLKVAIEKNTDLPRIKEIAESRLGMQKPDRYQLVYIKVPKSNYTVTYQEDTNNSGNNLFSVILAKFDAIKELFR